MKIKYKLYIGLFLCVSGFWTGCSDSNEPAPPPEPIPSEQGAGEVMEQLWSTSCLQPNTDRKEALDKIQGYADECTHTYFNNYLKSLDAAAESAEAYNPVLTCYRLSFDKVLEEVKSAQVEKGTTAIWMLYNMGYIVKTSAGCLGVDISHRYAELLEPCLDVLCITHNHSDHYSNHLIDRMLDRNKPVLSNYLRKGEGYPYTASATSVYTIGGFTITTNINDHNTSLRNFVTTFQIDCGSEGGNLVLMHVGDSNYEPSQYHIMKPVDVFIARYAPNELQENRVIGQKVTPAYVLLSHILELAHAGVDESRWSMEMAMQRAKGIDCENTLIPFWGERLLWKQGVLIAD